MTDEAPGEAKPPKSHPSGLYVLFGAEAWERFSYYGMRALLVLYLTKHLGHSRETALGVYAVYTGLVYLTPILGGAVADRLLGRRKAVLVGGTLMALGHLAMAFEPLLSLALGLLVLGNGFFKPNISTMVGGLYDQGDPRRDGAFTIFYMGINLGAFLAPLVCGWLGENVGWHWGFSAAAIGMLAGLAVFVWGQRVMGRVGLPPRRGSHPAHASDRLVARDYLDVALWIGAGCAAVWLVITGWRTAGPIWEGTHWAAKASLGAAVLVTTLVMLFRGSNGQERDRLRVVFILALFNIFFWLGFEQAGGTMTLFADKQTDRHIGPVGLLLVTLVILGGTVNFVRAWREEPAGRALWGLLLALFGGAAVVGVVLAVRSAMSGQPFAFPASYFQSVNPLFIVTMAPLFSRLWLRLDQGRFRTSTPTKMAIGMMLLGLGFVVMFAGQRMADRTGSVGPAWLAVVYALHTMGELCLSPIGLSMVTKLAPERVESLAMGLWLMSSAVANYLAGTLEQILERFHTPIYGFLVASSIGPALLLLALTPLLKRWMHGRG